MGVISRLLNLFIGQEYLSQFGLSKNVDMHSKFLDHLHNVSQGRVNVKDLVPIPSRRKLSLVPISYFVVLGLHQILTH